MGENNDAPRPGFDWFVTHKGQGKYFDTEWRVNGTRTETPKGYYTHVVTDYAARLAQVPRRHRPRPTVGALHRPKSPAQFYTRREIRPCLRLTCACRIPPAPSPSTASPTGSASASPRGTVSTARSSTGVKLFPIRAPRPCADFENMVRAYWGTVLSVDDSVGRLVAHLKATGQYDNTIIVFMGDNGLLEGEHGMVDKRTMHEPSIRIPLIVSGPGLPAGKHRHRPGPRHGSRPEPPRAVRRARAGQHPRPLLGETREKGGDPAWRTAWFYEYNYEKQFPYTPNVRGIRTDAWKLIRYPHGDGSPDKHLPELYDLRADPGELRNLAASSKHVRTRKKLEKQLASLLAAEGLTPGKDSMPLDEGIKTELPDQKIR
jgi:hypothetical protein